LPAKEGARMADLLTAFQLFRERMIDCIQRALDGLEADRSSREDDYIVGQLKRAQDYAEGFMTPLHDMAERLKRIAEAMRT
jgi:hypothetical protein